MTEEARRSAFSAASRRHISNFAHWSTFPGNPGWTFFLFVFKSTRIDSPGGERGLFLIYFFFRSSHGCCSGRRDDSARGPTLESAGASDAEPEGESAAEKTEGVGSNPDLPVRGVAFGGEGFFRILGRLRWALIDVGSGIWGHPDG